MVSRLHSHGALDMLQIDLAREPVYRNGMDLDVEVRRALIKGGVRGGRHNPKNTRMSIVPFHPANKHLGVRRTSQAL